MNNINLDKYHKDVWFVTHPTHLGIELIHWGVDAEDNYNRFGVWNYYIYIYESLCPETFEKELWFPEEVRTYDGSNRHYIYNKFKNNEISDFFRRDLNSYRKYGRLQGFRSVSLGCDYHHLCDQEYLSSYNEHYILKEAQVTADKIAGYLKLPILDKE